MMVDVDDPGSILDQLVVANTLGLATIDGDESSFSCIFRKLAPAAFGEGFQKTVFRRPAFRSRQVHDAVGPVMA